MERIDELTIVVDKEVGLPSSVREPDKPPELVFFQCSPTT